MNPFRLNEAFRKACAKIGSPYASGIIKECEITGAHRNHIDLTMADGKTLRASRYKALSGTHAGFPTIDMEYYARSQAYGEAAEARTFSAIVSPLKGKNGSQRILAVLAH
jgi:hypothetical protein